MKNRFILPLFLLTCQQSYTQNFIPLLVDSSHYRYWYYDFINEHDTVVIENISAYSYDAGNKLIQERGETYRHTFTYVADTVIKIMEVKGTGNTWQVDRRNIRAFSNGKPVTDFTEKFTPPATWNNTQILYFFYDTALHDTMSLTRLWQNGAWKDYYKEEREYNEAGEMVQEFVYYADDTGVFNFNQGKRFEYDANHHLTEEITLKETATGIHNSSRREWRYGSDNLLDTNRLSHYYDDVPSYVLMNTYEYVSQDTVIHRNHNWNSEEQEWELSKTTLSHSFPGPGIYSSKPDSIVSFYYYDNNPPYLPGTKWYYRYEDLGNGQIFYKQEEFIYDAPTDTWFSRQFTKEWYHLPLALGSNVAEEAPTGVNVYPNPCKSGQALQIAHLPAQSANMELLFFDVQGRLVSREISGVPAEAQAPTKPGVYFLLVRAAGRFVGVVKLVVAD
ncbi:MAG: hypothetical protein LCH81_20605 [Bacteroidetes bacterium]|nr:hypothetical protein [Bacteroidota bacterium]